MFIDPRTALAFRKIFGSEDSGPILISFLNAILYKGAPTIVDLQIINPYSLEARVGLKTSILDVKAELSTGERILIEMQLINVDGFEKRVLYNAAKEYVNQLSSGAGYRELQPVVALSIVNFELFDAPEIAEQVVTFFQLLEKQAHVFYPDGDIELVFVELPKFKMQLEELRTLTEKWIYFLKHAGALEAVPGSLAEESPIDAAFQKAKETGLSPEEADMIEKERFFVQDSEYLADKLEQAETKAEQAEAKAEQAATELSLLHERLKAAGIDPENLGSE